MAGSCTSSRGTRSSRSFRVDIVSLAAACLIAPLAGAQGTSDLRIRLDAVDGAPVTGSLIALLDERDSVVAEGLSSEAGLRTLRAPPGRYRVRVRRIGYLPFVSSPVDVPRQSELLLKVESPRVMLEGIVVNSKSPCKRTDPNSAALARVWDEVEKALRSSQLTNGDLVGIGTARTYRREVDSAGIVIGTDTTVFQITDRRPFGAIDPVTLAEQGYVLGDENKGWIYYAPDEVVLLSDQFAVTHCFRLVRQADRRGQIGVSFQPVPNRELSDISGIIWVDQSTSELREVVFRFVNAKLLSDFDAGGYTRFRRVPSGAWIVNEWNLSVPRLAMRLGGFRPRFVVIGRIDNGGGILSDRDSLRAGVVPDSLVRKR